MSFNSCKNLGADMILGNVSAKNINCQTISVSNPTDPTIPSEITVNTINASSGNFEEEITCPVFH